MTLTDTVTADQTVLSAPTDAEIASIDAWWRANDDLTIGQIYLMDNPLLSEKLSADQVRVVFSFHGFPGGVHQLVHGRPDPDRHHAHILEHLEDLPEIRDWTWQRPVGKA